MLEFTSGPVRIAYDREGNGPLIIFLHGIGGNRSNWRDQLEVFSKSFCAVAWDARGYGASDDPSGTLEFSDFTEDLYRLLDQLKAEKAHLVGLSMGGMILQDFYGRYQDRVATLALVDTTSGLGPLPESLKQDFLARRLAPLEAGLTPADFAVDLTNALVAPKAPIAVRKQLQSSLAELRVDSYKQALRSILSTDFRPTLRQIRVPTLVMVGAEDKLTTPAMAEALASAISGSELIVLENAGHLSNIEQAEAFNSALGHFLDRHHNLASLL